MDDEDSEEYAATRKPFEPWPKSKEPLNSAHSHVLGPIRYGLQQSSLNITDIRLFTKCLVLIDAHDKHEHQVTTWERQAKQTVN